ncbi:hypothetical protein BBK82_24425 [Lentzea guizhouensis]|uniref:VWFA domain-containing protein n=1 Tax=Lentzea guizhouensis TaxID=1586287 RepID=A0A1B2HM17_9PSEU|nr:hypothetical protein [Lentzea guizhouensis]ANZ38740.1 hypothetical protein BBK82_24425 [Lentzea guizhouensis]
MKRWLPVGVTVVVVLGLISGGLVWFLTPAHRTTFLIDSSESADFRDVAEAVSSAASNMSDDDALALRRFGGTCDAPNTEELVTPGTGQAARIGDTARAITPAGQPTLLSGVLAAIDDFARTYPFRGSETNRIVVVARGGADACGKNADEIRTIIKEHTERAGVRIDFRFVGHKLTPEQAKVLNAIAQATEARATRFTKDTAELVTTMKEVSVPASLVAQEVVLPKSPCEQVTPDALKALYRPEPGTVFADIKCAQDRYAFGQLRSTTIESNEMPVLFEFKDGAWQAVRAQTDMPCGEVPVDVWKELAFHCVGAEPVVCRDRAPRVQDLSGGWLGCGAAMDIAGRYRAAIDAGQAQGQGLFWDSGEWSCSWPYEESGAHVAAPLRCTQTSDGRMAVEIWSQY